MSKKIGIITFYYKNDNYGANLQAYALTKYLNVNGYVAEQICFDNSSCQCTESLKERIVRILTKENIVNKINKKAYEIIKNKIYASKKERFLKQRQERAKKTEHFANVMIPHSKEVYSASTIYKVNDIYDCFITGSDQVWNINMSKPAYFLDFVKGGKEKISYAASMAVDSISEEQKIQIKKWLQDYTAISVREKKSIDILAGLTGVIPEIVVDPTLLLTREEWDKCAASQLVNEDYMFCYFLGNNKKSRELALDYAKKYNLKIVSIPMYNDGYHFYDEDFGDLSLNDVSPEEFISLIKYAKYVFTDSFHCCVFSLIYRKQFFVFNRDEKKSMSSRIDSLMGLFECKKRYVNDISMQNLEYITGLGTLEYKGTYKKVSNLIQKSKEYIEKSVK